MAQTKTWNTTIKVRLDPTPAQAAFFDENFHCCRYLWNQMLSDQIRFYAETDAHFIPTPAKYKKDAPFLKEADSNALVSVHQNLHKAFQRFFSNPSRYRHPTFKSKKRCKNSYTTYCQYYRSGKGTSIYLTKDGIRLPKAGIVKARLHRRPLHWWTLKTATISKTSSGKYYCSLVFAYTTKPSRQIPPTPETTLGLNYSLSHFYIDSNGHAADPRTGWRGRRISCAICSSSLHACSLVPGITSSNCIKSNVCTSTFPTRERTSYTRKAGG